MKVKCYNSIPCPHKKPYTCCYYCNDYEKCDFEDKCELCPDECGNKNYTVQKGAKVNER